MAWKGNRKIGWWLAIFLAVVAITAAFVFLDSDRKPESSQPVLIKGREMNLETVSDAIGMYRGLSGRPSLCADCGMVFNFPDSAPRRFTMRGMLFPLDIIFLNQGKIVSILTNLPPDPPGQPSDYPAPDSDQVLEINAGMAEELGLEIGDNLKLPR